MDGLRACVHCGICCRSARPTASSRGDGLAAGSGLSDARRRRGPDRAHAHHARHLDLCLGCRACETACPSGVPFGQLLEATRAQFERRGVTAPRVTAPRCVHPGGLPASSAARPHAPRAPPVPVDRRAGGGARARSPEPVQEVADDGGPAPDGAAPGSGAPGADPGARPTPRPRRAAARLRPALLLPGRQRGHRAGSSRRPATSVVPRARSAAGRSTCTPDASTSFGRWRAG